MAFLCPFKIANFIVHYSNISYTPKKVQQKSVRHFGVYFDFSNDLFPALSNGFYLF